MKIVLVLVLGSLLGACRWPPFEAEPAKEEPAAADDGRPALSFTHWTQATELFIELPALVQGMESPCAAHVTVLADFSAPAAGRVTVVLRGGPGEERFVADQASVPGIFRPVVVPKAIGRRQLLVEVEVGDVVAVHDLGDVEVFASEQAAADAMPEEPEPAGRVPFLKEQQWPITFATEVVAEHTFRPSLRATGRLRGRDDGELVVTAPAAGRITSAGAKLPRIGARVVAEQPLFVLAPRLEASDQASLDLAVTSSRLELSYTEREREQLEALLREGAVPERRVVDARHEEEAARAALGAAERRLGQFRRVQRTRGGKAEGSIQVRAPFAGTISAVDVAPGAFVEIGAPLVNVVDMTRIWLEVHVPEADAARLLELHGGWFELEGFEQAFELADEALVGRSSLVDPETRTLTVLFAVENADAKLPLGAFADVRLVIGAPEQALGIPPGAVIDDGGQDVVYVQIEGEAFERRVVRLGPRDRGYVAVRSGLAEGEHVVTRGGWSIKLAAASGTIPAHGHAH
jgi:cobalt-zinc-cadmium efflux system membrane fusion protein